MSERSVTRGNAQWTVHADPGSGTLTFTITNATGSAQMTVDVDTAEEMRILHGSAIGTARGQQQ